MNYICVHFQGIGRKKLKSENERCVFFLFSVKILARYHNLIAALHYLINSSFFFTDLISIHYLMRMCQLLWSSQEWFGLNKISFRIGLHKSLLFAAFVIEMVLPFPPAKYPEKRKTSCSRSSLQKVIFRPVILWNYIFHLKMWLWPLKYGSYDWHNQRLHSTSQFTVIFDHRSQKSYRTKQHKTNTF